MKFPIRSIKYREYVLLLSYVALCAHAVIIGAYYTSMDNPSNPSFSYLTFILSSIVCVAVYIFLALSNGRYWVAFLKTVFSLPLILLNEDYPIALIIFGFGYFLLAFFDMYEYKVRL